MLVVRLGVTWPAGLRVVAEDDADFDVVFDVKTGVDTGVVVCGDTPPPPASARVDVLGVTGVVVLGATVSLAMLSCVEVMLPQFGCG